MFEYFAEPAISSLEPFLLLTYLKFISAKGAVVVSNIVPLVFHPILSTCRNMRSFFRVPSLRWFLSLLPHKLGARDPEEKYK